MENETKSRMFAINMTKEAIKMLDNQARQAFRSRSAHIRFLVEQENARQIAAVNRLPAVSEWVKDIAPVVTWNQAEQAGE